MNKETDKMEKTEKQNTSFEPEYDTKKVYPFWTWGVFIAVIILWAIFLPLGEWYQWLLLIALAVVVLLVVRKLCNPVVVRVPRRPEIDGTGNKETDKLLRSSMRCLDVAEKSMELITMKDCDFGYTIARLIGYAYKIIAVTSSGISEEKVDEKLLREYIPVLTNLLNSYMEKKNRQSDELIRDITDVVNAMLVVFEKQRQKLTIDSSTDFACDMEKVDEILQRRMILDELEDA